MSSYPEYKHCEGDWIKEIPSDWDIVRGKYLFEIKKRIVGKVGHDVLSITQKGIKIKDTESGDGQLSMDYSKYQIVAPGDFAMNHMDLLTGYVDISKFNGVTSPDYRVFTAIEAASSPRYFLYVFQMGYTNKIFFKYGQGASHLGRWRLPTQEFNNFWFPCPPKEDRDKIANFLDHETAKIDTLIEKQQQLIRLLKEKRQAVISHAVTKGLNPNAPMRDSGVEWLGEVPEHWVQKVKLSNVAESNRGSFVNGPFGSDLLADELRDEGVPVIYIRDIKRTGYKRKSTVCVMPEKAEQLKVCKVVSGDVIISKVGDPPGDTCIYPEGEPNAIITQDVIRIRVDRTVVTPEYLVMLLNSDFGQMVMNDISVEGTRKRVSLGDFKATKFVMPPLNDQNDIVDFVHKECLKMDALIGKSENVVDLIKERRTALISAAVTGKIDVRNWQAPEPSDNKNKEEAA